MTDAQPKRKRARRLLVALPVAALAGGGGGLAYVRHEVAQLRDRVALLEQDRHDREQREKTMQEVDERLRAFDKQLGPGPQPQRRQLP